MELTSLIFSHGKHIPQAYTGFGSDMSPPLAWSEVPKGVRSFALICDDLDAHDSRISSEPFNHWLIYNMSPNTSNLPQGVPHQEAIEVPVLAMQGYNSFGKIGYSGPKPPPNGEHRYEFTLYALDDVLELGPGTDRRSLLKSMRPHILATAKLMGTYIKPEAERLHHTELM
jgi:hypothetical protein